MEAEIRGVHGLHAHGVAPTTKAIVSLTMYGFRVQDVEGRRGADHQDLRVAHHGAAQGRRRRSGRRRAGISLSPRLCSHCFVIPANILLWPYASCKSSGWSELAPLFTLLRFALRSLHTGDQVGGGERAAICHLFRRDGRLREGGPVGAGCRPL